MLCPVCNVKIEFKPSSASKEDVYWDCSNCSSSLLLKEKEVEILSPGDPTGDPTGDQTGNQTGDQTGNQTGDQIGDQTGNQTGDQTRDQTEDPTGNLTENITEEITGETTRVPEPPDPLTSDAEDPTEGPPSEEESVSEPQQDPSPEPEEQENSTAEEVAEEPASLDEGSSEEESAAATNEAEDFAFTEGEEGLVAEEELEKPVKETDPSDKGKSEGEDLSEVVAFGKNQNQDRQGPYLYDLILKDINSKDTRDKVLSVLGDEYLNLPLSAEDLSIKNGCLTLPKISPIQTYAIVCSLMGFAISITWKQTHIVES